MADYSDKVAKVNVKLEAKGYEMTFCHPVLGEVYDPETGSYQESVETTNFWGIKTRPSLEEIEGGVFQSGSTVVLMAGDAVPSVSTSDYLLIGNNRWSIKSVYKIAPTEQVILYKLSVVMES